MSTARRVRLGFIGAGWWATANHMPLLAERDDVEMAAVCRLGRAELEQVRDRFAFEFATESPEELVNVPGLDAVVVSTPHTLHYEHARLALTQGLHVMCEKPLTTQAEHARILVQLAAARDLHLLVPYGWHYKPFVLLAKRWIDEGAIGAMEFVVCHMASPLRGLFQGRDQKVAPGQSGATFFETDPRTWNDPGIAGGGYGQGQLSHALGLLCWLTGLAPESAYAVMSAPSADVDIYDAIVATFVGGAVASISGAGTVPAADTARFQMDVRLFGTDGMLLLDCDRARLELHRHDGRIEQVPLPEDAGLYTCDGPPANFIDLIQGRTTDNQSPGEAAMRSVLLLDAAYRSALSGQVERC